MRRMLSIPQEKGRQRARAFIEAVGTKIGASGTTCYSPSNGLRVSSSSRLATPGRRYPWAKVCTTGSTCYFRGRSLIRLWVLPPPFDSGAPRLKCGMFVPPPSTSPRKSAMLSRSQKAHLHGLRLLAIEMLILETICVDFMSKIPFPFGR